MGYTHYWRVDEPIDQEGFDSFREEFDQVVENSDIATETYENTAQRVTYWPSEEHQRCETFYVTPDASGFNFIKTRQYPYSDIVCAGLLSLAFHTNVEVSSDGMLTGQFEDLSKDWRAGYELLLKARNGTEPTEEDCRKMQLMVFE